MEYFYRIVLRFRWVIIAIVGFVTICLGYFIKDLKVNADVLGYLPDDDPVAVLFHRIGGTYGGNELVLVGLEADNVFEADFLGLVKEVTDSIRSVGGVGYVTSLTNVLDIRSSEYGIEIGRLIDEYDIPRDQEMLEAIRRYTLSKPMYNGNLVAADASATLVIAKILGGANRAEVVTSIQDKLKNIPYEGQLYYGGMPVTLLELNKVIIHDIRFIAPVAFIFICLVLFLGFRDLKGVLLPMLSVITAIIWAMGLLGMLGYQITLLTNVLPVVLLAVGSAYTIHVINTFNQSLREGQALALIKTMAYVFIPVLLASLTTVLGFLSFIAGSYLTMIKEFGLFTAVGIIFSLLLALFFIPAVLSLIPAKAKPDKPEHTGDHIDRLTRIITHLVFKHQGLLLFTWIVLILAGIWGITRIERRVDLVDYFKKDNIIQKSEHLLKSKFNGSMPLYFHVEGDLQSPEVLNALHQAQEYMATFDYIPYSQSVADLIRQMNEVMGAGRVLPEDQSTIIQLWFLLEGQEIMDQLVSPDMREGIIQAYVSSTDLQVLRDIEANFNDYVQSHTSDECKMQLTGIPIMFKRLDDSIIRSQTYSLLIAVFMVVFLTSLLQRSLLKGLLAIIPILATLVVLFGTMGIAKIPLDIATVLTGSVTIGIGIDYAIHFMAYFGKLYQQQHDIGKAISDAIRISGRAILINVFSVSLGFAVLLISNLVPMQRFGFLIAVTMVVSGLAALSLLPVALMISGGSIQRIFLKNSKKP